MDFIKKVSVLKQVEKNFSVNDKEVSGILRIEIESGIATVFLSIINIKTAVNGSYFLYLVDENNKIYSFSLDNRPTSFSSVCVRVPDITKNYFAGVVYVERFIPSVVVFTCEKNDNNYLAVFKKLVAEKCLTEKKLKDVTVLEENRENENKDSVECAPSIQDIYDDEALATENYYELDRNINEKLKEIGDKEDDFLRDEVINPDCEFKEKEKKESESINSFQDETYSCNGKKYNDSNPYYLSAKKELDELFDKFPSDDKLLSIFPDSKWIKITYDQDKYYIVGTIAENKQMKYICYGVPSKYSEVEPSELKGYCSFIPLSPFNLKGDGYFMMFQDAITGECIKKIQV